MAACHDPNGLIPLDHSGLMAVSFASRGVDRAVVLTWSFKVSIGVLVLMIAALAIIMLVRERAHRTALSHHRRRM